MKSIDKFVLKLEIPEKNNKKFIEYEGTATNENITRKKKTQRQLNINICRK